MWRPPGQMVGIPFRAQFDARQCERIRQGYVPQQMEDKWFIYCEGENAYFHRSLTGNCLYVLELRATGDGREVARASVCADPALY